MAVSRQTKRLYEHIAISVGVICLCAVGFISGIYPAVVKISGIFAQKKQLLEEQDLLKKKLAVLDSVDEISLRSELSIVLTAVPATKSLPTLFTTVEGIANLAQVAVADISIAAVGRVATESAQEGQTALEKQIGAHMIPFVVSMLGDFANIQQFITLVPSVRRLVRIRTFGMQFPKDNKPLQVSLDMDAFYESLPTTLGAETKPIADLTEAEHNVVNQIAEFTLMGNSTTTPPQATKTEKTNPFVP